MKNFLKYLGPIFVILGTLCVVIYHYSVQTNGLLVAAIALEFVGIIGHIVINKIID